MSNVSKTNAEVIDKNRKLWLDTRGVPVITTTKNGEANAIRWGWTEAKAVAADALATRVPVQGEPNDDREALAERLRRGPLVWNPIYHVWSTVTHDVMPVVDAVIAYRATVPEAATETCGARAVGGRCVLPRAHNMGQLDIPENHRSAETERDAATAAIERVRALETFSITDSYPAWTAVDHDDLLAALDGGRQ